MALNPIIDTRDVKFLLFEFLEVDKLKDKFSRYADFDKDTFNEIVELAERLSVEKFYPAAAEGDKVGCKYIPETKEVKIPGAFHTALDAYYETGFIGIIDDQEIGGMGMPAVMSACTTDIFSSGCFPLLMYPGLAHGAMNLIATFGTDEQKKLYIDKIMSGEWGGTMCLTEPDAGSDVGALKTKAVKQKDGTYLIKGQKIFISAGESDYYDNLIHPVLARIEGDPAGTKGISIFIVPKYRVKPDGSKGEFNDVVCTGIEHKMGISGSSTASLSFGDEGKCVGYLLGEERKGMKIMFQMMNDARLGVGIQGLSISSAAYMHAVSYAKTRIQGVHVTQMMNPDAKGVAIIQHPDIKRMLLWMKSYVEGMRGLCYMLAHEIGIYEYSADEQEKKDAKALVDVLIPICKAGNTDSAVLVTSEAVQVFGGYGYTKEYPVEQMMRDAKILQIYEGTNGIQSMDLAMRKILLNPEQYNYAIFKKRVSETIARAKGIVDEKYITPVEKGAAKLDEVIEMMKKQMGEMKFLHLFMNATPLQQAMHMLVLAWVHLWFLILTYPKMKEIVGETKGDDRDKLLNDNPEAAYYTGKVLSSQFFIGSEFPKFFGKIDAILQGETAVLKASEAIFTGVPKQ